MTSFGILAHDLEFWSMISGKRTIDFVRCGFFPVDLVSSIFDRICYKVWLWWWTKYRFRRHVGICDSEYNRYQSSSSSRTTDPQISRLARMANTPRHNQLLCGHQYSFESGRGMDELFTKGIFFSFFDFVPRSLSPSEAPNVDIDLVVDSVELRRRLYVRGFVWLRFWQCDVYFLTLILPQFLENEWRHICVDH